MKPGTPVKWKQGRIVIRGRIVTNGGDMAQVKANGSTYELPTSALQVMPTCLQCGEPITKRFARKYCSRECTHQSRIKNRCHRCGTQLHKRREYCRKCSDAVDKERGDRLVFDAIVRYKTANDGESPSTAWLMGETFYSPHTVQRAISRLAKAGRLKLKGKNTRRFLIVVGGKWTYTEPST